LGPLTDVMDVFSVLRDRMFHTTGFKRISAVLNLIYQIVPGTRRGGSFENKKWLQEISCLWMNDWMGRWNWISKPLINERIKIMSRRTNESANHWSMNEWNHEPVNQWISEPGGRWMDDAVNPCINEPMNQWANECMNERVSGWMNEWSNESMNKSNNDSMKQWAHESTNQWSNESMNLWSNEPMNPWANASTN